jgi:hypothetical protein
MTNFKSANSRPGNKTDLHAVQQRPGESLHSFIQRLSQVRNTISRISQIWMPIFKLRQAKIPSHDPYPGLA